MNQMLAYEHRAQYYETDQMGIIHHSNYIRWFEEARVYLMEKLGFGYHVMEERGIMSPVLSVNCTYKSMTRFHEIVVIEPQVLDYTGVQMTIGYTIREKETGEIRCTGETKHCFITKEMRPVSLKRVQPDIHQIILDYQNQMSKIK